MRFVLFVDAALPDLAMLLAGVPQDGVGIGVPRDADALACMAAALGGMPASAGRLEEIGILCHGASGCLAIGRRPLGTPMLLAHASVLQTIGSWLQPQGRVRLMGCNVAAGAPGREFGTTMARMVGRQVVATTLGLGSGTAEFNSIFERDGRFTHS